MAEEKKICPLLSALMLPDKNGGKPGFSCLGSKCAWWVKSSIQREGEPEIGCCAMQYLVGDS